MKPIVLVKWAAGFAALAVVTALGSLAGMNAATMGFVYLVAVILLALWGGVVFGTVLSITATACYNFFFLPPVHTFTIQEPANWVALFAFLVASVVVSRLVVAARTEANRAEARRQEVEALYNLSIDLFTATNRIGALGEACGRALTLLGARAGGLVLYDGSPYRQRVVWWTGQSSEDIEDVIAGVGRHQHAIEIPSPLGRDVYMPLAVGGRTSGALVARGTEASKQALESVGRLVALAVERERFIEENAHVEALKESDALKTSLLRAVSHDLNTPLTAISIRTESLKRFGRTHEDVREDVEAIADETARLRRRIDNLLAMARLEAGRASPHAEPIAPGDLFRTVRESLPLAFESRPVEIRVDRDCPDIYADPSLLLEIIVNLVENAHRASPPGAPIELVARRSPVEAEKVRIEVLDRGPGFSSASLAPAEVNGGGNVQSSDMAQRGLGLEIARSLAAANHGTLALTLRPDGGTIARVDLPAAEVRVAGGVA